MSLDEMIALASRATPTPMEHARARRAVRSIRQEHARRIALGREITTDVDPQDPLAAGLDDIHRFSRAAELAKLGTVVWDARRQELVWSNEMAMILGVAPVALRPSITELFRLIHPDERANVRERITVAWRDGSVAEVTCRVIRPDRATVYVHCFIEAVEGSGGRRIGIVGTAQDHTEIEMARQENDRLARRYENVRADLLDRDSITGLLTRSRFLDEVDTARRLGTGTLLFVAAPPGSQKPGHAASDGISAELTSATAESLRRLIRPADTCGLVGPSEFGVLMPYTTLESAVPIAEEIISGLRDSPFLACAARLDARGGLVRYGDRPVTESADLLIDAEAAWRRAARDGVPMHVLWQAPSEEERRATLGDRIRSAVADNRFALYAQPIWDFALNRVTRHEILLRVLDGAGRALPPLNFLDLAERVDEILPVDRWVLDQALRFVGQGPQTSHYQINVSGKSLADPNLIRHIETAIGRYGVDPERLTLEITETALIGNRTEALRFAAGLRDLGCKLALDDFGAGFASLSYLKYFPIDLVKIDGGFIEDLPGSPTDQVIVRSVVRMCRDLGVRTAAEYVQDDATMVMLGELGVDFAQGYHIGRPELVRTERHGPRSIELELRPYIADRSAI
ncbi:hypothetical protein Q0Z83_103030 [Actinoplanes sichuanensis]|uniref:EAL domain-containing protein n=1 Tax=Actinoplanes sichuanensis TaxID=512349 RepID=A0ABW4AI68_9ACTN|nr:GGDEF domain-containing phosphodiesterase [Actinoplanes sichuanensis]BEL12112.1 hypothetical protein Q0Z83_103030 [Actinoplanes sichuanensis]